MKLKYYMRGLGAGITVTALLMSFINKPEELTDAQIKLRAARLGMVEEGVLSQLQSEEDEAGQEGSTDPDAADRFLENGEYDSTQDTESSFSFSGDETKAADENTENQQLDEDGGLNFGEGTGENQNDSAAFSTAGSNEENQQDVTPAIEDDSPQIVDGLTENYVLIAVENGNTAEAVSDKLVQVGLIESSWDYADFLTDNGYSKMLRVGHHEIPVGASYQEIAEILCGIN